MDADEPQWAIVKALKARYRYWKLAAEGMDGEMKQSANKMAHETYRCVNVALEAMGCKVRWEPEREQMETTDAARRD